MVPDFSTIQIEGVGGRLPVSSPITRNTRKTTRNTKNKILAMPAAVEATPPNPKKAAIIATTKNSNAQYSILYLLFPDLVRPPRTSFSTGSYSNKHAALHCILELQKHTFIEVI